MKKVLLFVAIMVAVCSGSIYAMDVDKTSYIDLSVEAGANIKLGFKSFNESANVLVVCGNDSTLVQVGEYYREKFFKASTSLMRVYGYISTFVCSNNGKNIKGIDVSKSPNLWHLNCNSNALTSIDVSKLIQLRIFHCQSNKLTSLDVSKNDELGFLSCGFNPISHLNLDELDRLEELYCNKTQLKQLSLRNNKKLKKLSCARNELTILNLQENPDIEMLNCSRNKLKSIDIRHLSKLKEIIFGENMLSTHEIDKVFCSLPQGFASSEEFECFPVNTNTDPQYQATLASTTKNATNKNWKVYMYGNGSKKAIEGNGNFDCKNSVDEAMPLGISVFPNPATSKVQVQLDESVNETLILVDLSGRALLTADVVAGRANIDVSNLTAGTYFLRIGNRVQKLTVK